MAKIFRFSGYFVDGDLSPYTAENFERALTDTIKDECAKYAMQQLHIEESEEFEVDGELDENCDLALLTRHFKHEDTNLVFDRPIPTACQKYRHFKLGKIVTIIGISRHTETEEVLVVYRYEDSIWCRPLTMFMSEVDKVKYPDAEQKYRFELVE